MKMMKILRSIYFSLKPNLKSNTGNNRGVALLLVIFSTVLISFLATEIIYQTMTEYAINAQDIRRLKAYYAARSGLELGLLRVKLFAKAQAQLGKQMGSLTPYLDLIWNFPFAWPPPAPPNLTKSANKDFQEKVKTSFLEASYNLTIMEEGSKIDINDLGSKSKAIQDITKEQIGDILNELGKDPDWKEVHPDFDPKKILNHIIDWIDPDLISLNGGMENQYYTQWGDDARYLPPQRSFRTLGELRLVAGMTPELFNFLEKRLTIYGLKAINPNYATEEVFKSLDPAFTEEVIKAIMERRKKMEDGGGPFKDEKDFWGTVAAAGGNVSSKKQESIPLTFSSPRNFRIQSISEYYGTVRQIEAVVFDLSNSAETIATKVKAEQAANNSGNGVSPSPTPSTASISTLSPSPSPSSSTNNQLPKGPPRIVYWNEI